ncbi:hypothetical protein KSE_54755 [Kitasatospora setae KM-6054]|uniref:Uncharacterized protein n=1 Tax=Kitasatospora setae (strain ATCC 33774 / DSM 43861 / JCM 3304 / KCC A-0304 / NBRC 14216 / KM-6054) TaxID=452652 RepID=E4NIC1_KITSK|nr:hypothetical protein KSE_54755 [Kitasatospora setae KM-6054]
MPAWPSARSTKACSSAAGGSAGRYGTSPSRRAGSPIRAARGPARCHRPPARLFAKLGARDRVHLVILAYRAGLAAP